MDLKRLRQILKALADDTRLRIINVVNVRPLTVKDICSVLDAAQPTVSKHLVRLRLLRIVVDKRAGNFVYYGLQRDSGQGKIVRFLLAGFKDIETFRKDRERLKRLRRQ